MNYIDAFWYNVLFLYDIAPVLHRTEAYSNQVFAAKSVQLTVDMLLFHKRVDKLS